MSGIVEKTADMLMEQLRRLNAITVDKAGDVAAQIDAVKAECERSKAVNDTARNIIGLGELHVKAEMLMMGAPERKFDPAAFFGDERADALPAPEREQVVVPANAWGDGARTRVNELGEFEDGD